LLGSPLSPLQLVSPLLLQGLMAQVAFQAKTLYFRQLSSIVRLAKKGYVVAICSKSLRNVSELPGEIEVQK
jgi:hypothetical protein